MSLVHFWERDKDGRIESQIKLSQSVGLMDLKIFCDGGAKGNPGPAAVGVVIKDKKGELLTAFGEKIGHSTNNIAEYQGVVEALKFLRKKTYKSKRIDFYLDSKLVVNQLNGVFKVKNPRLRELLFKVRRLEQEVGGKIFYHFVSREKNLAHSLVQRAFSEPRI